MVFFVAQISLIMWILILQIRIRLSRIPCFVSGFLCFVCNYCGGKTHKKNLFFLVGGRVLKAFVMLKRVYIFMMCLKGIPVEHQIVYFLIFFPYYQYPDAHACHMLLPSFA